MQMCHKDAEFVISLSLRMVGKELSRWTFSCIGTDTLFLFSMLEYLQVNLREGGDATAVTTHPGRRV